MSTPENTAVAPASLEAENWGDSSGMGIMAAMEKAFDSPPSANQTQPKEVEVKKTESFNQTEEVKSTDTSPNATSTPVKEDKPTTPIIDEEFFSQAPETAPEAKAETKPGEFNEDAYDKQTDEDTKGMDDKAGLKFKALRAELKAAKQTVITPDVQAKLSELEIKAAELDGVKARLAEISSQSAKLKVESGDKYLNEVAQPAADIFSRADTLAAAYEGEPSVLRAIIKERDRKTQNELISEHLSDFSDFDRSEVYRMAQDFNGLVAKRERMLANADREIEQQKVERIESDKNMLAKQRLAVQSHQKDIWNKYKEVIPGFVDNEGDTPAFKQLMAKGLSIDFSLAKASDMAFAAFAGSALPHVVKELSELKQRLKVYEKDEIKTRKRAPSPGDSVQITPSENEQPMSFMERFASADFT